MLEEVKDSLRQIGLQLDEGRFPVVRNGGVVLPSEASVSLEILGKEQRNAKSGKRSASGSSSWGTAREGATRRARQSTWPSAGTRQPATGSGSAGKAAPLVSRGLRTQYEGQLGEAEKAYPGIQYWPNEDGIWLIVESSLVPGLSPKVHFVIAISYVSGIVRGWAFQGGSAIGFEWIGPRHTNFPDGSICAFEPKDGTWKIGDPLVELLDLYTLWAVRHLHLKVFNRWPGYQAVPHPYERMLELRSDEYCGCANSDKLYAKCCMNRDFALDRIAEAIKFTMHMAGGIRKPPAAVVQFIVDRKKAPPYSLLTGQPARSP